MKYLLLTLLISICFLSCKKDNDSEVSDKTSLLTSTAWKYDSGGVGDANGNILLDFATSGIIPACSLDNSVKFEPNGSGIGYENTNVCASAPASSNFNWSFQTNQTILNVSGSAVAGLSGNFKIKELTNAKLTLLKDTTVSPFGSVTAIFNLKH